MNFTRLHNNKISIFGFLFQLSGPTKTLIKHRSYRFIPICAILPLKKDIIVFFSHNFFTILVLTINQYIFSNIYPSFNKIIATFELFSQRVEIKRSLYFEARKYSSHFLPIGPIYCIVSHSLTVRKNQCVHVLFTGLNLWFMLKYMIKNLEIADRSWMRSLIV